MNVRHSEGYELRYAGVTGKLAGKKSEVDGKAMNCDFGDTVEEEGDESEVDDELE